MERFPAPRRGAPLLVAAYPSDYRTAMSNLGFHFLLRGLRRLTGARVERAFTDTAPFTLESGTELSKADAILFSISYEEDFINLARMLALSGIALERTERRGRPLVIGGGAAVSANPAPVAGLADALGLGEGEKTIGGIASLLGGMGGSDYERLMEDLMEIEGIFVEGMGGRFPSRDGAVEFPRSMILSPRTVFPDTLLIESGRGCPGTCSFCLATSIYRPFRAVSVEEMAGYLDGLSERVGKVGLVSTAVAAHPRFGDLVELLIERGIGASFSSFRAEDLDEGKVRIIAGAGVRSVSLAPESGSERIRFLLGKRVEDGIYLDSVRMLAEAGIRRIQLYLLAGCPGEGAGTAGETRRFLKRVRENARRCRVSLHVNPLVPKPWTPLQYYGMPPRGELEERLKELRVMGRELGFSVAIKSLRSALRQATISLGDERVGRAIRRFALGGISWGKSLRSAGVDAGYPHEEKGADSPLPWDGIVGPASREGLYARYRRMID